jgi:hypothetical protein
VEDNVYEDDQIAGSWLALVTRLEARRTLDHWSHRELDLDGLNGIDDVVAVCAAGTDKTRKNAVMAALVRLAAADGGDDPDAVLLLLHLLSPGVTVMAAKYSDLAPDIMAVIVGELAAQIRAFPWRRRHGSAAANLLLDTRAGVLKELRPRLARGQKAREDILIDPGGPWSPMLDHSIPGPGEDNEIRLPDLLTWAAGSGVASREDLALLVELEESRAHSRSPRLCVAAAHGLSERTVRRRRDRALSALRQASARYLAEAA